MPELENAEPEIHRAELPPESLMPETDTENNYETVGNLEEVE